MDMGERKIRVILWNATEALRKNANKLCEDEYEIIELTDDVTKVNCDYILIPFENFRKSKDNLSAQGIEKEKIYTFEEFWVKDCESRIIQEYHGLWRKLYKSDIRLFEGKCVLITGGGSGIGYECAQAFLWGGANVIIAGRDRNKLQNACFKMNTELGSPKCKFIVWDIRVTGEYRERLEEAEKLFQMPIDILVNNAGVWEGKDFFAVSEKDFDDIINTNLKAAYFLCQIFAKYFIDLRKRGHIVNVISNVGFLPTVKPYGLAKWGMIGLTKGLGLHLAEYGITVNGVAPGAVATELAGWKEGDCPARRNAKNGRISFPCEIAQTVMNLAGFMGENMNGEVLACDGGDKTVNIRL